MHPVSIVIIQQRNIFTILEEKTAITIMNSDYCKKSVNAGLIRLAKNLLIIFMLFHKHFCGKNPDCDLQKKIFDFYTYLIKMKGM